jgi:hypothetical protein
MVLCTESHPPRVVAVRQPGVKLSVPQALKQSAH